MTDETGAAREAIEKCVNRLIAFHCSPAECDSLRSAIVGQVETLQQRLAEVERERDRKQEGMDLMKAEMLRLKEKWDGRLTELEAKLEPQPESCEPDERTKLRIKLRDVERELAAVRAENIRLRTALQAINTAWNHKPHHDKMGGFHFWYAAYLERIEQALAGRRGEE